MQSRNSSTSKSDEAGISYPIKQRMALLGMYMWAWVCVCLSVCPSVCPSVCLNAFVCCGQGLVLLWNTLSAVSHFLSLPAAVYIIYSFERQRQLSPCTGFHAPAQWNADSHTLIVSQGKNVHWRLYYTMTIAACLYDAFKLSGTLCHLKKNIYKIIQNIKSKWKKKL